MMLLYYILSFILLPVYFVIIFIRLLIGKEDIKRIKERFAIGKHRQDSSFLIWIHAASIGESMAALTLIHNISKHYPKIRFLVTSWTNSSAKILSTKLPKIATHQLLPIDNIIFTTKFLKNWQPNLGVFIESELWPCTINEAAKQCKLLLVNARISDKSFESWKKRKSFFQLITKNFSKIIVQSERDLQKFNELKIPGIQLDSKSFRQDEFKDKPAEHSKLCEQICEQRRMSKNSLVSSFLNDAVINGGNIKFANEKLLVDKEELSKLSSHLKDKRVIVFASTHPEDEEIILPIIKNLKEQFSDCYIILIPRHPERVKSIFDNCKAQNLSATAKSQNDLPSLRDDLYIVDRFGKMGLFFSIALISFIGGSFKQGGHNILEAANFSNCVIFGPDMSKNTDIAKGILQNRAAIQIKNGEDLLNTLKTLLNPNNSRELKNYQENSLKFIKENQKILDEYLQVIMEFLP